MRLAGTGWSVPLSLAAVALLSAGCGGVQQAAQRAKASNDLKQVGLWYRNYQDQHAKGPSRLEDLRPLEKESPATYQALKEGKYVLIWGVNIAKVGNTTGTVLGYEKDVPTAGGPVLMADASVKNMTADEFKAALKAAGKGVAQ